MCGGGAESGREKGRAGLEVQAEVVPFRVEGFDQGNFLGAAPLFYFLFMRDGRTDGRVRLEPYELGGVVLLREAGKDFFFVLADAVRQIAGHTEVQDSRFAGHEVDVEGALHGRGL